MVCFSMVFIECKCVDGISTYAHKCYLLNLKDRWFSQFLTLRIYKRYNALKASKINYYYTHIKTLSYFF